MDSFEEWRGKVGELTARSLPMGLVVEPLYREATDSAAHEPPLVPMQVAMRYRKWSLDEVVASIESELSELPDSWAWVELDRATRLGATHGPVDGVHVGRTGTIIATASQLSRLIETGARLVLDAGANALPLVAMAIAAGDDERRVRVCSDPLGAWARDGFLPASLSDLYREAADAQALVTISTLPYHNAGASVVQEVAFAIATAIDTARSFRDHRDFWTATPIDFRVAVTPDILSEVAKLRALRAIWWRLYGELDARSHISVHAVSSARTTSTLEPWINQLRTTAAGLAAQVGGADSFCPSAYDQLAGGSALGRRVARNTAVMMTAESHVGRVADAGGGAGVVEGLTAALARDAWALVQSIEAEGGMSAALASGWVREQIEPEWQSLLERYRDQGVLVGVNQFQSDAERLVPAKSNVDVDAIAEGFPERRDELELRNLDEAIAAAKDGVSIDDLSEALVRGTVAAIEPMPVRRIAAELGWEGGKCWHGGRTLGIW